MISPGEGFGIYRIYVVGSRPRVAFRIASLLVLESPAPRFSVNPATRSGSPESEENNLECNGLWYLRGETRSLLIPIDVATGFMERGVSGL